MAVLWTDFEGESEEGIKRFRAPFRFFRSDERGPVSVTLTLTEDVMPAQGDAIEIEGQRYLVRQVKSHSHRVPSLPIALATVELLLG